MFERSQTWCSRQELRCSGQTNRYNAKILHEVEAALSRAGGRQPCGQGLLSARPATILSESSFFDTNVLGLEKSYLAFGQDTSNPFWILTSILLPFVLYNHLDQQTSTSNINTLLEHIRNILILILVLLLNLALNEKSRVNKFTTTYHCYYYHSRTTN